MKINKNLICILLIVVCIGALPYIWVQFGKYKIRKKENLLLTPAIYEPVSCLMMTCSQSISSDVLLELSPSLLPDCFMNIDRFQEAYIAHNESWVIIGGGFYGLGYHLKHSIDLSSNATNCWILSLRSSIRDKHFTEIKKFYYPSDISYNLDTNGYEIISVEKVNN